MSGPVEPRQRGVRYWIALGILVCGGLCFALMHAMPMVAHAYPSYPPSDSKWTVELGWESWPSIFSSLMNLPHTIGAGAADAETWLMLATIAGFVMGGLLSLSMPLLVPLLRVGRLFRWLALVVVALAWLGGPGLIWISSWVDPNDPDYFRWEIGVYAWTVSGALTLIGLFLLPAREGVRNDGSAGETAVNDC